MAATGAYFPLATAVLLLGAVGVLPRVRRSTKGEGIERRYFYGAVWSVTIAQGVLLLLWKTLLQNPVTDEVKLVVYALVLLLVGIAAALGLLPRTRPIVPGEWIVACQGQRRGRGLERPVF